MRTFPFSWAFPNPGIEPTSPTLQVDSLPAEPPGKPKNTGMGSLFLLQKIFPTQESNHGLLHCRQILYQLSYQGSPGRLKDFKSLKKPLRWLKAFKIGFYLLIQISMKLSSRSKVLLKCECACVCVRERENLCALAPFSIP